MIVLMKNNMQKFVAHLFLIITFLVSNSSWSQVPNLTFKEVVFKGIYRGENLCFYNPFGSGGVGFCVKKVTVNGKGSFNLSSSLVEIDFNSVGLKIGDKFELYMKHVEECRPRFVNSGSIKNSNAFNDSYSYSKDAVLFNAVILDEETKKPIPGVNIEMVTRNVDDSTDYIYGGPGFSPGSYNIAVLIGKQYEFSLDPLDTSLYPIKDFKYSIKKVILNLKNVTEKDTSIINKSVKVEFLLPKKMNKSMDDLFKEYPVAKIYYDFSERTLKWDKDYENAISNTVKILKKQIEQEGNLKEVEFDRRLKSEELNKVRTQRLLLYGGILVVLVFSGIVFNRFRITKKQKLVIEIKEKETQYQKHLIEEKQREILDSINYAKRIQYTLLAHEQFLKENLAQNFVFFNPKDIVSGDFYWATKMGSKFYLAVCDSTGHGIPGAFMSLLNIGFLSEAINEKGIEKPNEVFDYVRMKLTNTISKEGQKDGFDGILVCFDQKSNTITYAAANNAPIIITGGQIIETPADRMPVGVGERKENFALHTLDAKPGDILYLYTDGYADQFGGPRGKKFKYKQLNDLLLANASKPLAEQHSILKSTFENWKGDLEQVDDVCIIGIKI